MANKNPKLENLKPFKKGFDPRRHLTGKPKSFDTLRELAQQLANEKVGDGNITIVQDILYKMATDKRLMKDFLEFAYGKVPQDVKVEGNVSMEIVKKTDIDPDKI